MNKKYRDYINELKSKKIAIIGLGVSNLPLIKILINEQCDVTLFDNKVLENMEEATSKYIIENNIKTSLGTNYLENLSGFDVIFRSPSMLPTNHYLMEEAKRGAVITTEIEQVIKLSPSKIIGITGSKGKTTTTTILYNILVGMGYSTYLGGNIGTPLFSKLDEMTEKDIVVLELSSFQLMNMEVSPNISIVTNISPDHLDVHGSYEEYIDAKKYIFKNQSESDILVLNLDDSIVSTFDCDAKGNVRYFKNKSLDKSVLKDNYVLSNGYITYNDNKIIDTSKLLLRGNHNYLNISYSLKHIYFYPLIIYFLTYLN